jgi:hypothetical protein
MPLQNRVSPSGHLHAVAERGTMLGNRGGKFHRDDRTLGRRRWASPHWICCELHYKGMRHEPMGRGYTSLFFLDEVTALAAGHRPCCFCRRPEALAFLDGMKVTAFDAIAHRERLGGKPDVDTATLPDGAMIAIGETPYAVRDGVLLPWSFVGYGPGLPRNAALRARLLTPPSFLARLAAGYQPRWHKSAAT